MQNNPFEPASLIPVLDAIPGPFLLMALLLYCTFVLHILLMNAVVGVAALAFVGKIRALFKAGRAGYGDAFSYSPDMLLPKGVALVVNLGVPPFLFVQCIYAQYIYSSSVLMAVWWLSVMLLVMLAYYGFYLNMARRGLSFGSRTAALGIGLALLLWNAFLFVNNMTLLQNPQVWTAYADAAGGAFLHLSDPQVLPRYVHIVVSCLAVGGVCLALPEEWALRDMSRRGVSPADALPALDKRRKGLHSFFYATLAQIPIGLWFYLALPKQQRLLFMGGDGLATVLFFLALLLCAAALFLAWKERAAATAVSMVLVIALMAGMRSMLRISFLEPYYAPQLRGPDAGALLLFIGSLVISTFVLIWLVRLYWRQPPSSESAPDMQEGSPTGIMPLWKLRRREALLVIELAHDVADGSESVENGEGGKLS